MVSKALTKLVFWLSALSLVEQSCITHNSEKIKTSLGYEPLLKIVNIRQSKNESKMNPFYRKNMIDFDITVKNVSNDTLYIHYDPKFKSRLFSDIKFTMLIADDATKPMYDNYGQTDFVVNATMAFPSKQEKTLTVPFAHLRKSEFDVSSELVAEFRILISSKNDISLFFEKEPLNGMYRKLNLDDGTIAYHYPFRFAYWIQNNTFIELEPRF